MPSNVLNTAVTASSPSDSINFTVSGTSEQKSYVYIYVAELQQLTSNETREFSVYAGEQLFLPNFRPRQLKGDVIYTKPPGLSGGLTYYIRPTANSTLPPLVNGLEAFIVQEILSLPTDQTEGEVPDLCSISFLFELISLLAFSVKAISDLKRSYGVSRNWQGDPCVPEAFIWQGLKCSINASKYSSIASV